MKNKTLSVFAFSIIMSAIFLSSCKSIGGKCGSWNFEGTIGDDAYTVKNSFLFSPENCGSNCSCDRDAIIQMTWVYDETDQMAVFPSDQQFAHLRATGNGWAIDQIDGWAYGYYGINNDGSFNPAYNQPGSNDMPTTLLDMPHGWRAGTKFYAVDVAVVYKSENCPNRILGSSFWSWQVGVNGIASEGIHTSGWNGLETEFQHAVTSWNSWAPGSGPEQQAGTTLQTAVPFPNLTSTNGL